MYNITHASVAPQLEKQRHVCTHASPPFLRAAGWAGAGGPAAPALARRLLPAFPALPELHAQHVRLPLTPFVSATT